MRDRPPRATAQQTPLPRLPPETATPLDRQLDDQAVGGMYLPPWDIVEAYAQLYLKHCNYQPLPLFSESLMISLSSRDPELLLAILALASRFDALDPAVHRAQLARRFE